MGKNILVIASHPDDEVLGMGGTIARHADDGDMVAVCILCGRAEAREKKPDGNGLQMQLHEAGKVVGVKEVVFYNFPNVAFNMVAELDLVRAVEECIIRFRPEIVYTHHRSDVNVDHRTTYSATIAAIRLPERGGGRGEGLPVVKRVLCYETPSSTDWEAPFAESFMPNVFIDISRTLERKLEACAQYKEIMRPFPHPRSNEAILALAQRRGVQAGLTAAEAFMLLRMIE